MNCHECAAAGTDRPAVALCRFCSIGLCKDHLVAAYRDQPTVPAYSCDHAPWAPARVRRHEVEIGEKKWLRTSA